MRNSSSHGNGAAAKVVGGSHYHQSSSLRAGSRAPRPPPPRRRPNIKERVSMLQMATLSHSGYQPNDGVAMAEAESRVFAPPGLNHSPPLANKNKNNKPIRAMKKKPPSNQKPLFSLPFVGEKKMNDMATDANHSNQNKATKPPTKIFTKHKTRIVVRCVDGNDSGHGKTAGDKTKKKTRNMSNNKNNGNTKKHDSDKGHDVWIKLI